MTIIDIATIGVLAREVLAQPGSLTIRGQTSKGIFMNHSIGQIVFLSREAFRGPYSLTLPNERELPELVDPLNLLPNGSIRDGNSIVINFAGADVYRPEPFQWDGTLSRPDFDTVCELARLAQAAQPLAGLCAQLQGSQPHMAVDDERWNTVWSAVLHGPVDAWPAAFSPICGYGRGLTPSGDDFLLGMLLGLRRYQRVIAFSAEIELALKSILAAAQGKTTTISLNLLQAANLGLADERLITAFDAWMAHSSGAVELHALLRTWGNSSGLDAFSGLAGLVFRAVSNK